MKRKAEKKAEKVKRLSEAEIQKMKLILGKMDFSIKIEYSVTCHLCGKIAKAESEEALLKKQAKHVDNECKSAKWIRKVNGLLPAGLQGGEITYLLTGRYPKGCKPQKENVKILQAMRGVVEPG